MLDFKVLQQIQQLVTECYDNDWQVFSWDVDGAGISFWIDGVSVEDFVEGELTYEYLREQFYQNLDYESLQKLRVNCVLRGVNYAGF